MSVALEPSQLLGVLQQAPGFVCYMRGPELVYELANAAYFQLVGHRPILGKTVREALPELEGQGYFELLDGVFASGKPFIGRSMKVFLQREPEAPPQEAYVDLIYQPIQGEDGQVVGILAQGHDVTEARHEAAQRVVAEEALRVSEARFRALFESLDDGFCLMELMFDEHDHPVDYRFLLANGAFEGQTGLENALGKTARELVPNLDQSWFDLYGRVALTGEPMRFENHAPAMGRWFDVFASRVGAPEDRLVALVFKDVSERKRAEEERERLLVLESEARKRAEEASRLKEEFLATVSHELRTPLSSMLGWVQMLRAGTLPLEKRDKALETIERNARSQAQLIEDLLDVSRILAGKLRLELSPARVQNAVEAALETVRPAADAKGITLEAVLESEPLVRGDLQRLQQVVLNLLSNAVKFTDRGGRVSVRLSQHVGSVEISVTDNGRGIAAEFQPHVFERFRQADSTSSGSHGGLGLGLSIANQLVQLHDGTISVYSAGLGHGAQFTVRIPVMPAQRGHEPDLVPHQLAENEDSPWFTALRGLRVLVVDDAPDTRDMIKILLESRGARVVAVDSAHEALAAFDDDAPDLLISDIAMPERDGYWLIERIRALPAHAGGRVPAVALTAYTRKEDRMRALMSGFNNHVSKPVEPLELITVVASLGVRGKAAE